MSSDGASINWSGLIALGIPNLVGIAAGILCVGQISSKDGSAWWQTIKKPSFTLATWLFGPVFIYAYSALGYASYLVYNASPNFQDSRDRLAVILYAIYNIDTVFGYTLLTRFHKYSLTFYNILFADIVTLGLTIVFYQINPLSVIFLIPTIIWQLYSSFLSHAVWILNTPKEEDYQNLKV